MKIFATPSKKRRATRPSEPHRLSRVSRATRRPGTVQRAEIREILHGGPEDVPEVTSEVETRLRTGVGASRPLPPPTRNYFEPRFQRDLGDVRLHEGPEAEDLCDRLEARALTLGRDVWLDPSEPVEPSYVLAHELAHVVQQTQPPDVGAEGDEGKAPAGEHEPRTLRRVPFWVPIDRRKGKLMTGTALHKRILDDAHGQGGIDTEAAVPNANRNDWGLDLQGSADLYLANRRVGIYFEGRAGNQTGPNRHVRPAEHFRAGRTPAPRHGGTGITDISLGPGTIRMGELKPADLKMLEKGAAQLDTYKKGYEDAEELTNQWAGANGVADRWTLTSVDRLPSGAVTLPSHYAYNPATPKTDENLALADIGEAPPSHVDRTKFTIRKLFVPEVELGRNVHIPGGLYAEAFGSGLWIYFARPADLSAALGLPRYRREERQAFMRVANDVQDEVIGNLTRGPQTIRLLRRSPDHPSAGSALVVFSRDPNGKVRRKTRRPTTKLRDDFKYKPWADKQKQLGDIVRKDRAGGKPSGKPGGKTFATLRFLELAYEADEAMGRMSETGRSTLPPKSTLTETLKSGEGKDKKTVRKALPDFFSWLEIWTSRPVRAILGRFRQKFGRAFVAVSNRLHSLRNKIREKMKSVFDRESARRSRGGIGGVALRALARAVLQIAKLMVPHTANLVVGAIRGGVEAKLEREFELSREDLIRRAEEGFPQIVAWRDQVAEFGQEARDHIDQITVRFGDQVEGIREAVALVGKVSPIVEAAIALLQCGTPPGWGCLKLLARQLTVAAANEVLSWCSVQKKVAGLVMEIHWFQTLPQHLAKTVLDFLKTVVPDGLQDVFDHPLPDEPAPGADEIDCDEGKGPTPEEIQALLDLQLAIGREKMEALVELGEALGIPDDAPLDAATAKKLAELLTGPITVDDLRKAAEGDIAEGSVHLVEFLEGLRDKVLAELMKGPGGEPGEGEETGEEGGGGGKAGEEETEVGTGTGPGGGGGEPVLVARPVDEVRQELERTTFFPTVVSGTWQRDVTLSRKGSRPDVVLQIELGGRTVQLPYARARVSNRLVARADEIKIHLELPRRQYYRIDAQGGSVPFYLGPGGPIEHTFDPRPFR